MTGAAYRFGWRSAVEQPLVGVNPYPIDGIEWSDWEKGRQEALQGIPFEPAVIEVKAYPIGFHLLISGLKTFEHRREDRGYRVGDILRIREWDPETEAYTGREERRLITLYLPGGLFEIQPGYCVLSLAEVSCPKIQ